MTHKLWNEGSLADILRAMRYIGNADGDFGSLLID